MIAAMNAFRLLKCVGYEDASYFSKVFHQYTGFSPSQYTNKTDHEE